MGFIDQELVSNKQILSFRNLGEMGGEILLLSVTRGMASREQKKACYQQYLSESYDRDPLLNKKYFNKNNNFELWCENELIGLCHNTASVQDWTRFARFEDEAPEEKDKETLFLTCSLDAVFILKKFRGKKIGQLFACDIREIQLMNLLGLLAHKRLNAIKHIEAVYFCDYDTKGGESFHMVLCEDFTGTYIEKIIQRLGYNYDGNISADYGTLKCVPDSFFTL
jgi:hypothetical protein